MFEKQKQLIWYTVTVTATVKKTSDQLAAIIGAA
jgi:hypothetical protein